MLFNLILNNIRSVHNVGSIFRTADGAGVSKILLSSISPAPIDRFGRKRNDLAKVALGAEDSIPWEKFDDLEGLIFNLKKEGFEIVALEQSEKSIDYKKYKPEKNIALIIGEEVTGLSDKILDLCDKIIEIPMKGNKESLNVSVATGIALYKILDQK